MRIMRSDIGSVTIVLKLPRRLLYARDHAFVRELAEADAAEIEIAHIAVLAAAAETTTSHARLEFRRSFRPDYD